LGKECLPQLERNQRLSSQLMTPQQKQQIAEFQKMIDSLCVRKIKLMTEVEEINNTIIFLGQQRDDIMSKE
jgi:hypothetical protein